MEFAEALAHQMRGMTIMYFLIWNVHLYNYRKQNRMMKFLFIATLFLTFGFLKDSIFLAETLQYNRFVDLTVGLTDVFLMLMVCCFFLEAVQPGFTKSWKVLILPIAFLILILVYVIVRKDIIAVIGFIAGMVMALGIMLLVGLKAIRQRKFLNDNYSYDENISVRWAVGSCCGYILLVIAYPLAFDHFHWINESVYCLLCMLLWAYIIISAKHHKIILETGTEQTAEMTSGNPEKVPQELESEAEEEIPTPDNIAYITEMVAHKLTVAMESKKLYLNPLLSVKTVAMEIGTNTKYVSLYLNHTLGMTFYDYINRYRVEEACRIIESMVDNDRINMEEVSRQAGFNSVSTFNRHFRKVKGTTPIDYFKRAVMS